MALAAPVRGDPEHPCLTLLLSADHAKPLAGDDAAAGYTAFVYDLQMLSIYAERGDCGSMQQKSPLSQRRLDWIQALRGVAALSVVLTHTRRIFLDTPMWDQADKIFFPFATGVDLFFVISGFIMVYTTFGQRGPKASDRKSVV